MDGKLGVIGRSLAYVSGALALMLVGSALATGDPFAVFIAFILAAYGWSVFLRFLLFMTPQKKEGVIDIDTLDDYLKSRHGTLHPLSSQAPGIVPPYSETYHRPTNRILGQDNRDLVSSARATVKDSKKSEKKDYNDDREWSEMTRIL